MVKDGKKGVYGDTSDLGVEEKNIPHTTDSIYEEAEQEGKKTVGDQDSFMSPEGKSEDLSEEFQRKFAAQRGADYDCDEPEFIDRKEERIFIETERVYSEVEVLEGEPISSSDIYEEKELNRKEKITPEAEGVYEKAKELGRVERIKPAETDSIYKEAEILAERTKEDIDDFMAKPEKEKL